MDVWTDGRTNGRKRAITKNTIESNWSLKRSRTISAILGFVKQEARGNMDYLRGYFYLGIKNHLNGRMPEVH